MACATTSLEVLSLFSSMMTTDLLASNAHRSIFLSKAVRTRRSIRSQSGLRDRHILKDLFFKLAFIIQRNHDQLLWGAAHFPDTLLYCHILLPAFLYQTTIYRPQHFLNFLPLPQGQGSLRPVFAVSLTSVVSV